jgi:hypothetical protein
MLFGVSSAWIWNQHIIFIYQFDSWVISNVHRLSNVGISLPTTIGRNVVDKAATLVVLLA